MSWPNMVNCLQESIKASFYESDETVRVAYADLITSSKETLDSI
jgi:protein AATF/BFR2